jgi:hypothetical protein
MIHHTSTGEVIPDIALHVTTLHQNLGFSPWMPRRFSGICRKACVASICDGVALSDWREPTYSVRHREHGEAGAHAAWGAS